VHGKTVKEQGKLSVQQAADVIRKLVRSASPSVEQKVAFERIIDSLTKEADYLLDEAEVIKKEGRKKILLAYRELLSSQLEAVEKRINDLKKSR
jgi:hypothetical protein